MNYSLRTIALMLVTSLAVSLASCSKKDEPAVAKPAASTKFESAPAVAVSATPPAAPVKEEPSKPAPLKEELEAVTPATAASQVTAEAEKAKLQAEQNALKEQQAKATAANDEAQKTDLANRIKQVEQKINALPRPDLGEDFEARATTPEDGTRAALDKLLNNAPKDAPAPGSAPAPASPPAPANPQ